MKFIKGRIPWNKGTKGLIKPNSGSFKKGEHTSKSTEFKKGEMSRDKHPFWNGGRYKSTTGYVFILNPEHPNSNSDGYVREHRLVIESSIGRFLERSEKVHHINGIRHDNRLENLILCKNDAEHFKFHRSGRWSKKYDHCIVCKENTRHYEARGMCSRCYKNWQYNSRLK